MNTFGERFRVTTFGESHGPAIGAIIDGCPAGLPLSEAIIQPYLDLRRPGRSPLVTKRDETDKVKILSGVFEGVTTGTPIALVIENTSMHSGDYEKLRDVFRPGHADYTYYKKYGVRDHRGGGRSSGRETAARVAAGAVAMQFLKEQGILITGEIIEIHGERSPENFESEIKKAVQEGDSVGGIITVTISGCRAGLGDPVFGKLDALLAGAMMGIGGVKAVEIGKGFGSTKLYGSENNDERDETGFLSNNAGGILGGISTGQDIIITLGIKPTPSILKLQKTVDIHNNPKTISIDGRHDPCIVIRALPVVTAMASLVIINALLESQNDRV